VNVRWLETALIASGAIIGWLSTRKLYRKAPRAPSREYLAGVNYLVKDEPDRAVEAFLRAVSVERDMVETQFALGALFRRRGEVDRAIRVHQNLIAREALEPGFREQAKYALAQDYLRAGLYDRAEALLRELCEGGPYQAQALHDLLSLYETEREWARAIEVHKLLERHDKPDQPEAIAHYHCELAEEARKAQDLPRAREELRLARRAVRKFPRGALVRADVAIDMNEPDLALRLLRRVPLEQPQLAGEVLARIVRALKSAGRTAELSTLIGELAAEGPAVADAFAYATIVAGELDSPALLGLARDYIAREPSVAELVEVLRPGETILEDGMLKRLCAALKRQALRAARFRCSECGFSSNSFFWQCPGCKRWDSQKPLSPSDLSGSRGSIGRVQ
jgi:lipopolysaccharide assembly protein B